MVACMSDPDPIAIILATLHGAVAPVPIVVEQCETCEKPLARSERRFCTACLRTSDERRRAEGVLRAIPEAFAPWAAFGNPRLRRAVKVDLSRSMVGALLAKVRVTFRGPTYAGKTALASACFREWVGQRRPGWATARFEGARHLGLARARHGMGHHEEPPEFDRAIKCGLLVIDDFGNESCPPNFACLGDIVFRRHELNRPTWVTTGLSEVEVEKRYGVAIQRRLFVADGPEGDPYLAVVELGRKENVHNAR